MAGLEADLDFDCFSMVPSFLSHFRVGKQLRVLFIYLDCSTLVYDIRKREMVTYQDLKDV